MILTTDPAFNVICPSVTTVLPAVRPAGTTASAPSVKLTVIGRGEDDLVGSDHIGESSVWPDSPPPPGMVVTCARVFSVKSHVDELARQQKVALVVETEPSF